MLKKKPQVGDNVTYQFYLHWQRVQTEIRIGAFHTHQWFSSEGDELLKMLSAGLLTLQRGAGFQHWIWRDKEI